MVNPELIEAQIKLERDAISYGIVKLNRNVEKCEQQEYASGSIYGLSIIQELVPVVEAELEKTRTRIKRGQNGYRVKEIAQYLDNIEAIELAGIALKITFDKVFSKKQNKKRKMPPWCLSNVVTSIGTAVEHECQMRFYEAADKDLYKRIKQNYWDNSTTQQRYVVMKLLYERKEETPNWEKWSTRVRLAIGGWLLDAVLHGTGMFKIDLDGHATRKHAALSVFPSDLLKEQIGDVMQQAIQFAPAAWPMLIPPNDWSPLRNGGYLLNEVMKGHHFIRKGHPLATPSSLCYEFINNLQKVSYQINPFVYEVAEQLHKLGHQQGKFLPRTFEYPDIPQPPGFEDQPLEVQHQWRKEQTEQYNLNSKYHRSLCVRTEQQMEMAERFAKYDRFYLPWSFDYRGRVYPIPPYLTPQDTDFGKALIRFAEPIKMNRRGWWWLAVWAANCAGEDKVSYKDRVKWTLDHHDLITRVATDPLGNLGDWEVDDPWQFLAACEEYYHCCILKDRPTTSLMVAVDGTCSGLQVLSGLSRDANTARLVNVLPGEKPQDAYKAVAELANETLKSLGFHHLAKLARGDVKRVVMTIPYNATTWSNCGYLRDAIKDTFTGQQLTTDEMNALIWAIRGRAAKDDLPAIQGAMQVVVPGALQTMAWLNKQVKAWMAEERRELTWVTPSGFVVYQKLMKPEIIRFEMKLYGQVRRINVKERDSEEVNKDAHCSATAPNLIHSLDATLLHIGLADMQNFTVIHDSILGRAPEMFTIQKRIRKAYADTFGNGHLYLKEWAEKMGAVDTPTIYGTFDPRDVVNSLYFFS
jgi:DNA-directed RNA polymerase